MGGCSTYQIRKIYAIGQALGIVNRGGEDALHDLVYGVTGKSSVKELSYSEACKVIGELEARQGTPPPRPKKTNHRKRKPGGVSEGQERKVWALMYRLAAASPSTVAVGDRLRAAIKKEAGVDAFADDPFAWLDYKSCNKLIEALKGYIYDELTRWRTANRDTAHLLLARGVGTETGGPLTADSAEPKSCGDYRAEGLPCREAVKGPGSVNQSMKWLQSLAAICIDPKRCPDTAREFGEYEYEVGKDGQVLPGYPDADNHHIDAVRYATNRLWTRRGT